MNNLSIKELSPDTWIDFEQLFEDKGGPKNCWCMVWRNKGKSSNKSDKTEKKKCMFTRVNEGIKNGILCYFENQPVAWCSIAPKSTYKNLTGKETTEINNVWSLVCFYIKNKFQKQGIQQFLIDGAIEYATLNGATKIEAYPVDRNSPSFRFMGNVDVFEKNGFNYIGDAGNRRKIYQKKIT